MPFGKKKPSGAFREKFSGPTAALPYQCGVCQSLFATKSMRDKHSKDCKDARPGQGARQI